MKTMIKLTSIALLLLAIHSTLLAQNTNKTNSTTYSIETDPSTFVLKGYAIHFRIKPKNSKHVVIGAGAYGLNLPNVMVDLNKNNREKGWDVRINSAFSFFGEYYFKKPNSKWFVGLQIGVQNYRITNKNIANKESTYSNILVMPSIGYTWQPFKFPLYMKPWLGIGYTSKIFGTNSIDNLTYEISPLVPFVTLHIGYTFNK